MLEDGRSANYRIDAVCWNSGRVTRVEQRVAWHLACKAAARSKNAHAALKGSGPMTHEDATLKAYEDKISNQVREAKSKLEEIES